MNKIEYERANFDEQKNKLKKFANNYRVNTYLPMVEKEGFFFSHKVTGEEMNSLVEKVQKSLAQINERQSKTIKTFETVYETFDILDKGYIQKMLLNLQAANEASEQAKKAQKDINDTIDIQKKTIHKLKEFKDSQQHFGDVDRMYEQLEYCTLRLEDYNRWIDDFDKAQSSLNEYVDRLKSFEHIEDIDNVWELSHALEDNMNIRLKNNEEELTEYKKLNEKLTGKLNSAYLLIGASIAISLIQLVLVVTGVL